MAQTAKTLKIEKDELLNIKKAPRNYFVSGCLFILLFFYQVV